MRYDEAPGVVLAPAARLIPGPTAMDSVRSQEPTGPSLGLIKAEAPDHPAALLPAGSNSSSNGRPNSSLGSIYPASNGGKRPRTDDWPSNGAPTSPQDQRIVYMTSSQHQPPSPQDQRIAYTNQHQPSSPQEMRIVYLAPSHQPQQMQQPPMAHSTPISQPAPSNGYASPMSSGSYDPYSPNGKIG